MPALSLDNVRSEAKIFMVCVVASITQTYFSCISCRSSPSRFTIVVFFTLCIWYFLWRGNAFLATTIDKKVSWLEEPVKRLLVGVIATLAYSCAVVMITIKMFEWIFSFYLGSSTMPTIILSIVITVVFCLFSHGRAFFINWRKLELDAARMRNETLSSRYESLRTQVDPHFLFNSLNVLTTLVYEDADKSALFIKKLSEVYRYVLDTRNRELVTVPEELAFVDSYLYLQQIRFDGKLRIVRNITASNGSVPPLVVQMLVENAIKHNIVSDHDPLVISISASDQQLSVVNNLQPRSVEPNESPRIGLDNIRRRFEFFTDRPVIVRHDAQEFSVTIPVLQTDHSA